MASITSSSSPKLRNAVLRVLLLAAVLVNVALAVLALRPNVSENYRAFFIDHTTDCLIRPVDGKLARTVALLTSAGGDLEHVVMCGMGNAEPNGSWTTGQHLSLLLPTTATASELVLQLTDAFLPGPDTRQRLELSVNGVAIGSTEIKHPGAQPVVFPLPASALGASSPTRFDILLPDADSPAHRHTGDDQRILAVHIGSVGVLPAGWFSPSRP